MTIDVLLVDELTIERQAIAGLLTEMAGIRVIGESPDGFDALEKTRALRPNVVLMDYYISGLDGVTTTRLLRQEFPDVNVILLNSSDEEEDILAAAAAGAQGYLLKTMDAEALTRQIERVASGASVIGEVMLGAAAHDPLCTAGAYDQDALTCDLTEQEEDVLSLIGEGLSNREISSALQLTQRAVRADIYSLIHKLGVESRTQLVIYGLRDGLFFDSVPEEFRKREERVATAATPTSREQMTVGGRRMDEEHNDLPAKMMDIPFDAEADGTQGSMDQSDSPSQMEAIRKALVVYFGTENWFEERERRGSKPQ